MKNINFLIKPASSTCNLRCRYCFYEDEAENRTLKNMGLMTFETAEVLLLEAFRSVDPRGFLSFAFQGGEPTLAGLDFFRQFVKQAKGQKPPEVKISFSIQTNGTQIDDAWAKFFHDENFLVGISVDGCKKFHNTYRVDSQRQGTWNHVRKKVELLQKFNVQMNALCVVTKQCARHPQTAYQTLKKMGFDFIQFIACLDPIGAERGKMPWSLTADDYGKFLCQLFDLWYKDWEKGEYHSIRLFDDYIHLLLGDGGSTCATCGQCGEYFVVEGDGSVYPCDFYALDDWKMGRLGEQTLIQMAESELSQQFRALGSRKPSECHTCQWRRLCNGGCKNDWIDGPRNYYCEAFQALFRYAGLRMQRIAYAEMNIRKRYTTSFHK